MIDLLTLGADKVGDSIQLLLDSVVGELSCLDGMVSEY